MCFPLAMYSTGVDAQMPWVVPYGWWLIRAQMEDMNQRRRGEETINLPNGNPLWGAWASRPSTAVAVFICDLPAILYPPKSCCLTAVATDKLRTHTKASRLLAPGPPVGRVGATWRWCGFYRQSAGDPRFPCDAGRAMHMCYPYPSHKRMTPSLWRGLSKTRWGSDL